MKKIAILTDRAPKPAGNYSQAISTRNFIFLSGQIGLMPDSGKLCSDAFGKQLNQVFSNLAAVCESCGYSLNHIAKMTVYLTDINNSKILNDEIEKLFCAPYPARSVVGVSKLPLDSLVEIEAIIEKN